MKKCPNCETKYRDTDFYCFKDNYKLVQCNDNELTEQEKMQNERNNNRYNNPNNYGNFVSSPKNVPHCPVCNSSKIHKISTLNKVGSVATFGILATGHVSKTFKCDSCGMKF